MTESIWHGDNQNGIEIRPNEDGTIDEVCMYLDGRCIVHIEQMNDAHWWLAMYGKTHEAHVNFFPKSKRQTPITMMVEGWTTSVFACAICGQSVSLFDSTIQDYKRVCRSHV